ncbi:DUF2946 family protein [Pseudomonas sp. 21LCFQ010]|uniref:DUF2946 family protein n=1 Tax=Pseudomonas sp. 21LCFQ010 TaxID=2957506 RepID=UPI002096CD32|nr:DUF2946 family protein [Pseudomonas sp. 21LCFQ010]MCO8166020.1 DUF2946 family protein [Pseudomonas sp. 21LCFQ010]
MTRCGLNERTWDNVWVAALLAIVMKIMMLPMASAFAELNIYQLLQGSFCSSGGLQYSAPDETGSGTTHSADKGHCLCSQGSIGGPSGLVLRLPAPVGSLQPIGAACAGFCSLPRHLWPSLSPRASPGAVCSVDFMRQPVTHT